MKLQNSNSDGNGDVSQAPEWPGTAPASSGSAMAWARVDEVCVYARVAKVQVDSKGR